MLRKGEGGEELWRAGEGVADGGAERVCGWGPEEAEGLRVQDASDSAGVLQARCQPACEQGRGVGI